MLLRKKDLIQRYILIATMMVASPALAQRSPDSGIFKRYPTLEKLHVDSEIMMRYARTRVTCQMFNPHPRSTTINFALLLPENAFITAFSMISDGQEYNATVEDKNFAYETYSGIDYLDEEAGLIAKSSRDANIFDVSMTARPLKRVVFKLTHEQALSRENSLYTLPIHLHLGELSADISVTVSINETSPIRILQVSEFQEYGHVGDFKKNLNAVVTRADDKSARILWKPTRKWLRQQGVTNGIMSVQYDVTESNEVLLDKDGNFLQIFQVDAAESLPKHVVFVLDVSFSMHGQKLEKMKEALSTILDSLPSKDEFSLIFFSNRVKIWTGSRSCHVVSSDAKLTDMAVLSVTSVNISKAKKCIGSLRAFGGTDAHEALKAALEASRISLQRRPSADEQLMVIFLTDGKPNGRVNDPFRIERAFTEGNARLKASLFALGFGEDADFEFLRRLSLQNGGFSRRIYEGADAARQLENFYRTVASPVLSGVRFVYRDEDQVNLETPSSVPLLFNGSSVMLAGTVAPGNAAGVAGSVASEQGVVPVSQAAVVVGGRAAEFLGRLRAYLAVRALLDKGDEEARELALQYNFVTKYTSLIVTRPEEEPVIAYEEPTSSGKSHSFSSALAETPQLLPDSTETPFTGLALEDIEWLVSLGNGSFALPEDFGTPLEIADHKDAAVVERYQRCHAAEEDEPGHCYQLRHCVLQDFLDDYDAFADRYLCLVNNRFVGVCCPDKLTAIF